MTCKALQVCFIHMNIRFWRILGQCTKRGKIFNNVCICVAILLMARDRVDYSGSVFIAFVLLTHDRKNIILL